MARSNLRIDSSLDVLSCAQTVEDHEPIDVAAAIVHGVPPAHFVGDLLPHELPGRQLTKLARLGALVHTMHLPYVIVGRF